MTRPTIWVRPVEGRLVNHHQTKEELPADWMPVEDASYWRRLKAAGDIEMSATDPALARNRKKAKSQ